MEPRLIAVRLPLDASAIAVIEAIWDAGDALLPLDPGSTQAETERLLARMRPHALLDGTSRTPLASPAPVVAGTALVIATSGTTGAPKGVVLGHAALEAATTMTNAAVGAEPGQRWFCCLPLHHIAGFMTLLRSRALGTEAVAHPGFDVAAFDAVADADFVSVVPTMLFRLLEANTDLTRFQRVLVGGAAVDDELVGRAGAAGARVTVTYGMSETCGGVIYDGVSLEGVDVALADDGRISIASPTVMDSYRLDDDASARALVGGRFVTQDRGAWTDDGRLRVLGRLDRTIISGGKNISPDEIEDVLREHPGVLDAHVFGEPDPKWGEIVVATVIPTDPASAPTTEDLDHYLRARLSPHKLPRKFHPSPF